jgi:hypothetical protein
MNLVLKGVSRSPVVSCQLSVVGWGCRSRDWFIEESEYADTPTRRHVSPHRRHVSPAAIPKWYDAVPRRVLEKQLIPGDERWER